MRLDALFPPAGKRRAQTLFQHRMGDQGPETEKDDSSGNHHRRIDAYRTLVPGMMAAVRVIRKRIHYPLVNVQRRGPTAQRFGLVVNLVPKIHGVIAALRRAHDGDTDIAIEPLMQNRGSAAVRNRDLAIRQALRQRIFILAGLRPRRLEAQVRVGVIVWSIQVIVHHAYFPSSRCWSASRAL